MIIDSNEPNGLFLSSSLTNKFIHSYIIHHLERREKPFFFALFCIEWCINLFFNYLWMKKIQQIENVHQIFWWIKVCVLYIDNDDDDAQTNICSLFRYNRDMIFFPFFGCYVTTIPLMFNDDNDVPNEWAKMIGRHTHTHT